MSDDVFADLPDKGAGDAKPQDTGQDGGEGKVGAVSEENASSEEQKGGLSKAVKQEEKRVAELERLRELRAKKKQLSKELEGEDPGQPAVQQPDVSVAVQAEMRKQRESEYEGRMVEEIKALAKSSNLTKADAQDILDQAKKIGMSGNAQLDVKFAADRVFALRRQSRTVGMPTFGASSPFDAMDGGSGASGISDKQKEINKQVGVSDEDFKKYGGGFNEHAKTIFKGGFLDRSDLPANANV